MENNSTKIAKQKDIGFSVADLVKDTNEKFTAKVIDHKDILHEILDKIEPVNFRQKAGMTDDKQILLQKHLVVLSIKELLDTVKTNNYGLARKNDFIFAFNGEFWKELDRDLLKDFLAKVADKQGVNELEAEHYEFRNKLFFQFIASANFQQVKTKDNEVLINLQNGTFEISKESLKLRDFNSSDFLTYRLSFDYEENAKCPMFEKFLNQVLPEKELQDIVAEFLGYVFTKNLKLEKALLIYGGGANGKSVLFDIMNALLGKENVSNFSLCHLLEEHNRACIANKLLNYGSEINASKTKDEVKQIISNEPIQARMKYGHPFIMEKYAKLVFNCNELPKDIDYSHAYFRRLLIVPFRITIAEENQDKTLADKIIKSELSGVFNWIIAGLKRIIENENFTHSEIVKNEVETYKRESDSVASFIDENNYKPSVNHKRLLKDLYADYKFHCQDDGNKPLSNKNFAKRLKNQNYQIERLGQNKTYIWIEEAD
jgi:putative DNA primase/helicase